MGDKVIKDPEFRFDLIVELLSDVVKGDLLF